MDNILKSLPEEIKEKLKKTTIPEDINPMLATLTEKYFSNPNWIYEKKWDGYRILAYKSNNQVTLLSRRHKDYSDRYHLITEELKKQKASNFILDGEVVAYVKDETKFSLLQQRDMLPKDITISLKYHIFDILYLDDYDTTKVKLINRKNILEQAIKFNDILLNTTYIEKDGIEFYNKACSLGWEGIIAKNKNSLYINKRSKNWLKFKCNKQQEFIIVGYTDPEGSRIGFGSLLLGYYQNSDKSRNKLKYAGKVGTGFNDQLLRVLSKKLKNIEIPKTESDIKSEIKDLNVHFVKPLLVGEIKFTEWTEHGKLRHPSFLGLRENKDPKKVIREIPN